MTRREQEGGLSKTVLGSGLYGMFSHLLRFPPPFVFSDSLGCHKKNHTAIHPSTAHLNLSRRPASTCVRNPLAPYWSTVRLHMSNGIFQSAKGGVWIGGVWNGQISGPEIYLPGPEIRSKIAEIL